MSNRGPSPTLERARWYNKLTGAFRRRKLDHGTRQIIQNSIIESSRLTNGAQTSSPKAVIESASLGPYIAPSSLVAQNAPLTTTVSPGASAPVADAARIIIPPQEDFKPSNETYPSSPQGTTTGASPIPAKAAARPLAQTTSTSTTSAPFAGLAGPSKENATAPTDLRTNASTDLTQSPINSAVADQAISNPVSTNTTATNATTANPAATNTATANTTTAGTRGGAEAAGGTAEAPNPDTRSPYRKLIDSALAGVTEAIEPQSHGFNYKPLIKVTDADFRLPDLIRVLIVHQGEANQNLEISLQLRLLPLLDNRGHAQDVVVDGVEANPESLVDYIALSYAWGGQQETEQILIRHQAGTTPHLITPNLKSALLNLRQTGRDTYFWADAICIFQNKPAEKSQQLPLMSRIYSEATSVCVWLGEKIVDEDTGEDVTKKAFTLMRTIRRWKLKNLVKKHTTCDEWLAFVQLINVEWFKRRWVVQEIVLAGEAELRCGEEHIDWMEFAQAVALFEAMEDQVRVLFKQNEDQGNPPEKFGKVSEFSANQLVKVTTNVVRRRDDGRVDTKTESLETLISSLTQFKTGDPKDVVYAILSLAKDIRVTARHVTLDPEFDQTELNNFFQRENITDEEKKLNIKTIFERIARNLTHDRFPVDYNKRFDQICDDLYNFITHHSGSLDMICRPWCPPMGPPLTEAIALPSWVCPIKGRAFTLNTDGDVKRVNADTLVGLPGRSPYTAAKKVQGQWHFERDGLGEFESKGTQILSVRGFQLDVVDNVENPAEGGNIPSSWLEYRLPQQTQNKQNTKKMQNGIVDTSNKPKVSEQFWTTMVAGQGANGDNPPLSYSLVAQVMFDKEVTINLESERKDTENPILREFISRVFAVVCNRRLTRTLRHKCLALVPSNSQNGDIICILPGCSVPVVLRKTGEQTIGIRKLEPAPPGGQSEWKQVQKGGEDVWQLVGECYMYGMMFGDALKARREGSDEAVRQYERAKKEYEKAQAAQNLTEILSYQKEMEAYQKDKDFFDNRRVFKIR